ncbi:hypothetical protein F5Y03DRAFT_259342 [Xylaria venustula]|nr:hypothetical protein F5Y03DRAFT_259342 [Xylaria venustula]
MPSILVLGATGFIGAPFCRALKKAHPDWHLSAQIRRIGALSEQELAARVGAVDNVVEISSWTDFDAIKRASAQHDVVINAGNSFTGDPVTAIVAGLQERKKEGKLAKLIHISGCGNFIDGGTSGNFNPESKVWSDDKTDDIKQIHPGMFNGQSDTVVLKAGSEGGLDTYIVCPPVVYGGSAVGAKGLGVGYRIIVENARSLGYVPYVGEGTALITTVHLVDLVNFLVTIAELAVSSTADGTAYERFYITEGARVAWKALATELAKVLHRKDPKTFPSPESKGVSFEAMGESEAKHLIGANMLVAGPRALRAGFQPKGEHIVKQLAADFK